MSAPASTPAPSGGPQPRYRRIVLKLSGEALKEPGSNDSISPQIVLRIASEIRELHAMGIQIAVV